MTIISLFSGAGGLDLGLIQAGNDVIWANDIDADAVATYKANINDHIIQADIQNIDITKVPSADVVVGGFPCQDYSVARTNAQGISGKKGILWWQISDIIKTKKPPFILLENVDRLLKSPSTKRGRDFGIMLRDLNDLGYGLEWRIINAAEYGFAQRRRRVFIFCFNKKTNYHKSIENSTPKDVFNKEGIFAKSFSNNRTAFIFPFLNSPSMAFSFKISFSI